jgi:hypothetical protein
MGALQMVISRFLRHPVAFSGDVMQRLKRIGEPSAFVHHTWEEALASLKAGQRVALIADGSSSRGRIETLGARVVAWVSDRLDDQAAGAMSMAAFASLKDLETPDAVVVAGADLPTKYSSAMRWLETRGEVRPVLWVGGPFEFAGSTLPIPREVDDASFHLFHHFFDFFGVKESVQVLVRAQAPNRPPVERLFFLKPRHMLSLHLNELLPRRDSEAVVEFICTHPVLSRGRHTRWRVWGDLSYKGSLSSLHGAHDYGPSRWTESRLPLPEMTPGSLAVTFPNYGLKLSMAERTLRWGAEGRWRREPRAADRPIEQRNWTISAQESGFAQYCFFGHGESFWFNLGETTGQLQGRLMSNHQISVENTNFPLRPSRLQRFQAIVDRGFLLHPHYVPLSSSSDEIQWGFSFAASSPQVRDFLLSFRDHEGLSLGEKAWKAAASGVVWTTELQNLAPAGAVSVVVAPDWQKASIDPQKINFFGHLFARHRDSGDMDATEFQNCWRNIGVKIDEFPHWIHPSKAVNARTHLIGRVLGEAGSETFLLLVLGSGFLSVKKSAGAKIEVIRADGKTVSADVALSAFTHRTIAFHELFADLDTFLEGASAGCRITSGEADFNAQIVTRTSRGGLSLQHLWGY